MRRTETGPGGAGGAQLWSSAQDSSGPLGTSPLHITSASPLVGRDRSAHACSFRGHDQEVAHSCGDAAEQTQPRGHTWLQVGWEAGLGPAPDGNQCSVRDATVHGGAVLTSCPDQPFGHGLRLCGLSLLSLAAPGAGVTEPLSHVIAGRGRDLGFPARWAWPVLILCPQWSPALQKPGCTISPGRLCRSCPTSPSACGLRPWLICPHCPPGGPLALLLLDEDHPPGGMQFILLQEILPPLCPGQHGCFSSGNPARLGEKESPLHEACQPAQFSTMSAVGYQVHSDAHLWLVPTRASMAQVRDGAKMKPLCRPSSWATGSRVCSPEGLGSACSSTRVRSWPRWCPQPDPRSQRSGTAATHPHSPQLGSW